MTSHKGDEVLQTLVPAEVGIEIARENTPSVQGVRTPITGSVQRLSGGITSSTMVLESSEIADITWAAWCSGIKTSLATRSGKDWGNSFIRICCLVFFLYFFLASLDLMGGAFKVLGGCDAGGLFNEVTNPVAGLMIGILATVLVQSSSTSTSIVVSLVGSGAMSVRIAVPIVMGANIGTSVTNTIVSMGQMNDPEQFKRAFAGATVHDMFNFLSVIILLPLEVIFHPLEKMTDEMRPAATEKGEKWTGPIKKWVGPLVKAIISPDKDVIKAVANGKTTCAEVYGEGWFKEGESHTLIKGGLFKQSGATLSDDMSSGWLCLIISLICLCLCLGGLVKTLKSMIAGTSEQMMKKATNLNGYLAMLVGAGITVLVQSSSITTSVLTPLVGLGILEIENMFPLTLGANIGTTCTALLASMVSSKPESVQIALCHLFFNIAGIAIWYPIPFMRRIPIAGARALGSVTARYRFFPILYIAFAFVGVPVCLLGISSLFTMGLAFKAIGVILVVFLCLSISYSLFWYLKRGGRETILKFLDTRQSRSEVFRNLPETVKSLNVEVAALQKELRSMKKSGNITPEKSSKGDLGDLVV